MRFHPSRSAPWLTAAALLATTGCSAMLGSGGSWTPPEAPRTMDGLDLVTADSHFQREYVKPGLDLAAYDAVFPTPLQLAYTPGWKRDHRFEDIAEPSQILPEGGLEQSQAQILARLRSMFRDALEKKLTADGAYRIVDAPGPGVLELSANVINLDLGLADVDYAGGLSIDYTVTPIALMDATLKDAAKGTLLGKMLDSSQGPDDLDQEGAFWSGMYDAFQLWAYRFRQMLDDGRRAGAHPK